jgi:tripartite-type tricarboxylate transporter receptor subunit TctC
MEHPSTLGRCLRLMRQGALAGLWLGLAALLAGAAGARPVYPAKPVKIIVPFGPGSATDIMARLVAEELQAELGQPFIVDNRAGANGFIAAEAAARAPADGHTLFITSNTTQTSNPFLFKKLPYDPVKDFAPISAINEQYYVLAVPGSLPVNSVAEFVAWLKANPDKASYGWGAAGAQIAGAAFLKEVGATAAGVPYKSSPQVTTDLIGGQLSFTVQGVTSGLQVLKSGRLKALMVSAPQRVAQLPDVPTGAEAGVPGFRVSAFVGVFAPAGTPAPVIGLLNATLLKALRKPEMTRRIDDCCAGRFIPSSPEEFAEYLAGDRARWAAGVKAAGIQPE